MDIDTKNRTELKSYFTENSIPTQSNFAELIEAMINQKEDGIVKISGLPLSLEAVGDDSGSQKIVSFYRNFSDSQPEWSFDLNLNTSKNNPPVLGFNVTDKDGNSLLFIDLETGNVGIGVTYKPGGKLVIENVNGEENGLVVRGDVGKTYIPHANGDIYLTGYIGGERKGRFIFRTFDGSNYSNKLVIDGTTGTIVQEDWHEVADNQFQNGWRNYTNSYNNAAYFKDSMGIVHLRGLVKSGSLGHDKTIFILPVGYRPAARELHATIANDNLGRVDIKPNGRVTPVRGSSNWFSLDGVTFQAAN